MQIRIIAALIGASLFVGVAADAQSRLRSTMKQTGVLSSAEGKLEDPAPLALLDTLSSNSTNGLPSIDSLESIMASLEADKKAGKVTPGMTKFASTVKRMIHREMLPGIMKAHHQAKRLLRRFALAFRQCGHIRSVARRGITSLRLTKRSTSSRHKVCRRNEAHRFGIKRTCQRIVAQKLRTKRAACGAFRALIKNPNSEANNCHTTGREPYHMWLTRNRKDMQRKLRAYQRARLACIVATRAHRRVNIPCIRKTNIFRRTRRTCIIYQYRLETSTCTLAKRIKDTCDVYTSCYDTQVAMYKKQKPKLMVQEKDRKGEWRALKRIDCLLTTVFGSVKDGEINQCKKKTHSTRHLNLKYPKIPNKQKCDRVPPIPNSKLFAKLEYSKLGNKLISRKPSRMTRCILAPGGGLQMSLQRNMRRDKCRMENGWLVAQNGGSCLIAGRNRYAVMVPYTRKRFTKYRFTMKMDEVNSRDKQSQGGGFEVCNNIYASSFINGNQPMINFVDTVPRYWGYHLQGGWTGVRRGRVRGARCSQILTNRKLWGLPSRGVNLARYTNGRLRWIGNTGRARKSFFCKQYRDGITFGSTSGIMRAMLGVKGKKEPKKITGCCSSANPSQVCNAPDRHHDVMKLCKMMGYTRGRLLQRSSKNTCPEAKFSKGKWTSDFVNTPGFGQIFECKGPSTKSLYTNKNYYKQAEPKAGQPKQWDLTMQWRGGKYLFHSLKIEGRDFSGYRGMTSKCPRVNRRWAFAPRIGSFRNGKTYIKDLRVFQGNSLKKMRQVVGEGIGRAAKLRKAQLMRAALRAAKGLPKCRSTWNWATRNMYHNRRFFIKHPRARPVRRWNSWAVTHNVKSIKVRMLGSRYQHMIFGITGRGYTRPNLGLPYGMRMGIWPGNRAYVWGKGWIGRWRPGHTAEIRIHGRNTMCAYLNNRRKYCRRYNIPRGVGTAQIWFHERGNGIAIQNICKARR